MNPLPLDEYDERQRAEAESQIRRMTARLENERIRAQTGPRVEAWKAERSRAAWKDTRATQIQGTAQRTSVHREADGDASPELLSSLPQRGTSTLSQTRLRGQPVSSPTPAPLGRSVPPEWRSIQLHRRNPGEWKVWLAWGACSVPWLLLLWRFWS